MGEMLKATPRNPGAKGIGPIAVPSGNSNPPPTLRELGISKKEAMNARRLFALAVASLVDESGGE